jgi:hypothetical protein
MDDELIGRKIVKIEWWIQKIIEELNLRDDRDNDFPFDLSALKEYRNDKPEEFRYLFKNDEEYGFLVKEMSEAQVKRKC